MASYCANGYVYRIVILLSIAVYALGGCASRGIKVTSTRLIAPEGHLTASVSAAVDDLDRRAFHFFVNGNIQEQINDFRGAAESYEKALKYHPDSYQIRYNLARAYFRLQNFQQTIRVLDEIEPIDIPVLEIKAASFRTTDQRDSARVAYRTIVDIDPGHRTALSYLISIYNRQGDLDSSAWALEQLAVANPTDFRIWQDLARIQISNQNYDSAIVLYEQGIEMNASAANIRSFIELGELYQKAGMADSGVAVYKRGLSLAPDNPLLNRILASYYVAVDSLHEAVKYAQRLARQSSDDPAAVRRLGLIYIQLDSLDKADSIFSDLVQSEHTTAYDHYYLGTIAILGEEYDRAISELSIAAKSLDTLSRAWLDLGYAYRKTGDTQNEIESYRQALQRVRESESRQRLLFALGAVLERDHQIDSAIAAFEEILASNPEHDGALNYLGYMLADLDIRLDYARSLIERAISIAPDNPAYVDSYGWIYFRLGDYARAIVHLERAAGLVDDAVILDHLGDAYHAVGNNVEARKVWQKALGKDPENDGIKEKLAN